MKIQPRRRGDPRLEAMAVERRAGASGRGESWCGRRRAHSRAAAAMRRLPSPPPQIQPKEGGRRRRGAWLLAAVAPPRSEPRRREGGGVGVPSSAVYLGARGLMGSGGFSFSSPSPLPRAAVVSPPELGRPDPRCDAEADPPRNDGWRICRRDDTGGGSPATPTGLFSATMTSKCC